MSDSSRPHSQRSRSEFSGSTSSVDNYKGSGNSSGKRNKSRKRKARRKWAKAWKLSKWVLILLFCYSLWASYKIYDVGHHDAGNSADCAIVLGAAAYHINPSPVFKARLDHAIKLYQEGRVQRILLTGGKGDGAAYAESEVGRFYCLKHGIPDAHIYLETTSLTTHENIQQAKMVMQQKALESALIVSDPWHLRRASLMADDAEIQHECSATLTTRYQSFGSKFSFFCREFFFVQVYHVFGI